MIMTDYVPMLIRAGGFLLATFPGSLVVNWVLKPFSGAAEKLGGMKQAGKYIGNLERAIIVVLVFNGAYSALGFVFAAKSIARFNRLKDRQAAEYYLVGTLASVTWAVIMGELSNLTVELFLNFAA